MESAFDEATRWSVAELWKVLPHSDGKLAYFPTVYWSRGYVIQPNHYTRLEELTKPNTKKKSFKFGIAIVAIGVVLFFVLLPIIGWIGALILGVLVFNIIHPSIERGTHEEIIRELGTLQRVKGPPRWKIGLSWLVAPYIVARSEHLVRVKKILFGRTLNYRNILMVIAMPIFFFMGIDEYGMTVFFPLPELIKMDNAEQRELLLVYGFFFQISFAALFFWFAKWMAVLTMRTINGHWPTLDDLAPHFDKVRRNILQAQKNTTA